MKQFFKFMFASMLGIIIAVVILFFITGAIISGLVSKIETKANIIVQSNSILKMDLNYDIAERSSNNPLQDIQFPSLETKKVLGLNDILENIKKAKDDPNIKGIYLDAGFVPSRWATLEEIRNALMDFKKSKKFIYAYGEVYSQKGYYLSSVADKIFLNPTGIIEFKGFATEITFFKHTLEKLEIEPQVFYNGKFKSFTEPFRLDKMSEPNRLQVTEFLNEMYAHFLTQIADSRKLSFEFVDSVADNLLIREAEDAKQLGIADELFYEDQALAALKEKLNLDEKKEISFISMNKYLNAEGKTKLKAGVKDRIAIIYAEGDIVDGKGNEDEVGSTIFAKAISDARLNEKVKAIVLRVNSPGGSALASDIIWREVILAKKKKPVVVSMGGVAASGGYYISCAADTIVAQPNSLTGSIGVLGIIPNMQKFFNNKLGMTFDGVKTGKFSDMPTASRPLTEEEKSIVQHEIDIIYRDFVSKVAEGRGMSIAEIDSIAQGRVWSGTRAKEIGLVDVIGGIDDAVKIAASMAKIENYRIINLPEQKDPFTKIISELSGEEAETRILKSELGENYKYFRQLKKLSKMQGIQAVMPFEMEIH